MIITNQRIELRIKSTGVYNANKYNIEYGKDGSRVARENPRFKNLKNLGGKIVAKWKKEIDIVETGVSQ